MNQIVEQTTELLKKKLIDSVIESLVIRSPFFSSWLIAPLTSFFVTLIIDELYKRAALAVNWVWIIVENNAELSAAIKTKERLALLLNAGENYAEAEKEFDEATDKIIRHNFDRLPH